MDEAEKVAIKFLKGLKSRLLMDRQQLINLMVGQRDNKPANADLANLQQAYDSLEAATGRVDAFINSRTGQLWEKK